MCGEVDFHAIVDVEPFWVVVEGFRDQSASSHESKGFAEVCEFEFAVELFFSQYPIRFFGEGERYLFGAEFRGTCHAFSRLLVGWLV